MTIDKQELRKLAELAIQEEKLLGRYNDYARLRDFKLIATPDAVLSLLNEIDELNRQFDTYRSSTITVLNISTT